MFSQARCPGCRGPILVRQLPKEVPILPTTEAQSEFERRLAAAGFRGDAPDPLLAWRVFREFAAVPFGAADDRLLFQCGVFTFSGPELFELDFTRQFAHEIDGEYDHMEQLQCTFYFTPEPDLRPLSTSLWSSEAESLNAFFTQVEALPEFQVPITRYRPLRVRVTQEGV